VTVVFVSVNGLDDYTIQYIHTNMHTHTHTHTQTRTHTHTHMCVRTRVSAYPKRQAQLGAKAEEVFRRDLSEQKNVACLRARFARTLLAGSPMG